MSKLFNLDQSEYAIKIIRKDKGYTPELATRLIELETETMVALGTHPWLVNLVAANKSVCIYKKLNPNFTGENAAIPQFVAAREEVNYMVLEKCTNGALSKYVRCTGPFEEQVARFLFTQLSSAVHFMHSQEYVHLDIKLDNILLDEYFNLKLADLGIALCARNTSKHIAHKRGTTKYMAPEVERASMEAPFNVFNADIYSMGICLHLMLLGMYPEDTCQDEKSTGEGTDKEMTSDEPTKDTPKAYACTTVNENYLSEECRNLLYRMIHPDPQKRPTIFEIFEHPWMAQEITAELQEAVYLEMSERSNFLQNKNDKSDVTLSLDLE